MNMTVKKVLRPAYWLGGALAIVAVAALAVTQMAVSAKPMKNRTLPGAHAQRAAMAAAATPAPCNGTFSDGTQIKVGAPTYLQDVPGDQLFCDFHTFAWNQFIYLTQMQADPNNHGQVTPLFLHMAPWYNLLMTDPPPPKKAPVPGAYPGGDTELKGAKLDQGQAGDDDRLIDVKNGMVQYDIRFNKEMYDAIKKDGIYTLNGYTAACKPGPKPNLVCANQIWLPPTKVAPKDKPAEPGSMEIKSSWRDFGSPANCPATQFYCNGRFGLVGMHIVQKTQTHGEWIWASFEHVANDPDCYPGGDTPIAAISPLGTPWSFFNPATAGVSVMSSLMCEVSGTSPQCNADPKKPLLGTTKKLFVFTPVNVCRTDALPSGGASAANCQTIPDGPPQQSSNSGGNVVCLNATLMPQLSGVWKNYKMIGSQWVRGTLPPTQTFQIQVFQPQPPGPPPPPPPFGEAVGFPHLANTTMETWMQSGSTGYDVFDDNSYQAGCFNCHDMPTSGFQADLSHFVGKLPKDKQDKIRNELLSATSLAEVVPPTIEIRDPVKPRKPAKPRK